MAAAHEQVTLLYDDDAYVDSTQLRNDPRGRVGVMGRQVAGKEFLEAYLKHGRWSALNALVFNRPSAASITNLWKTLPPATTTGRQLRIVPHNRFHSEFFPTPPARTLHLPTPLDARYAYVREHRGPAAYALSGVTHTLCTARISQSLCDLVRSPFESYDTLFCTSHCAVAMVRSVTENYCDFLKDRYGGNPKSRVHLAHVPLGVNPEKFRPATAEEREVSRQALEIHDDEIVVLCVGRLSYHAKAHPFPVYSGLARAAQATGKKIHLVFFGWAANEGIGQSFRDGAKVFASGVRVTFVDGTRDEFRHAVWHAADMCASLSDNFQETFGLVITEAMSSGLPIVASDWDGYRDQIVDGQTGLLVPTQMVRHASRDITSRLLMDETDFDLFLAESNQTVVVDTHAAAAAFSRLINDEGLRRQMGAAARQRVLEMFAWEHVVRAYEQTWDDQEIERQKHEAVAQGQTKSFVTPACFPDLEASFGTFPTSILDDNDRLVVDHTGADRFQQFLKLPLTNYAPNRRSADPVVIEAILSAAAEPQSLAELDELFQQHQIEQGAARATIAWMLKYSLLRRAV